ncbi:AMP-dependent synthetase/ligase [Lacipirellula parvula]|uniref:Long-chain-fatty-acid--CoA ligase n=1 Tax=Lacipirellula parvula TaxID=2650471 RepID=A0A5K7X4C9_9BACT|nr:AMP-binding protein [Lacipirellula parvula]BBO31408.1 long-chain-fatty-acid--CoA ligase [Lacipirellula parvula]
MTPAELDSLTIPALLAATVAQQGSKEALGTIRDGQLTWLSWNDLAAGVDRWRARLEACGVAAGDRVAQLGPNSADWILVDLAIQSLGAVHVPLHAALAAAQVAEQVGHSGAKLLVVDSLATDNKLRGTLPSQVEAIVHDDCLCSPLLKGREQPSTVASGNRAQGGSLLVVEERNSLFPNTLATILYTSGTTGPPRGVMLTQRNLVANAVGVTDAVAAIADEIRLCLLPLSHIYARTCDLYSWIYRGTRLVLAESRDTILRDCQLARPTVINAVPYFYQKVADGLAETPAADTAGALRNALGGAVKRCYCGGAGLAPEVEACFESQELPILSGYGLTEASPVVTATTFDSYAAGTVGRPLPNLEVRLADDGELQVRGPNVMAGYWRDETATAAAIQDGWLQTGDLAVWSETGNLRIVGRKREMIVLATGNKVAPTRIEQLLVGSPWIEQCCVVGDGRKCLAALIVPNPDKLRQEIRRRRLWVWSRRRALTHPKVLALYREEIDRCLAAAASFEQVGPFTLLGRGFSIEAGEMTPKLSLCRGVIERVFSGEIEALYRGGPGARTPRLAT